MTGKRGKAREWPATVASNIDRGGGYHVMTLSLSARFPDADPGNFVMLSVGAGPEILLRRPMAIYDLTLWRKLKRMEILYTVVGRGTAAMSQLGPGMEISLLGPIGNAFDLPKKSERITVVAGGVGIAPFLLWARRLTADQKRHVRILLGFREKSQMGIAKDFRRADIHPLCAVEAPGGEFRGTVVDLLEQDLQEHLPNRIFVCGPEKMMERVCNVGAKHHILCDVSLEAKMGCGLGVCLSCVTQFTKADRAGGYALVCQDGPIFRAQVN